MDSISEILKVTKGYEPNIKKPSETLLKDIKTETGVVMTKILNYFVHTIFLVDINGLNFYSNQMT